MRFSMPDRLAARVAAVLGAVLLAVSPIGGTVATAANPAGGPANAAAPGADPDFILIEAWFTVTRVCVGCPPDPVAGSTVIFKARAGSGFLGDPWTGYAGTVAFSSSDPQAVLPGPYSFTGAGGDAGSHDFSVTFRTAGPQTLTVYEVTGPSMTGTSDPVTVVPAAPHHAAFTVQPGNGVAGSPLSTQPKVAIQDLYNNLTSSTASVSLVLVAPASSAGALLTCTSGTTLAAVAGIVTYAGCQVDRAGNAYSMQASAPGLATGGSAAFDVTGGPSPSPSPSTSPGPSPSPAPPVGTALVIAASATSLSYPTPLTLSIAFAGAGTGRLVTVQERVAGATDWVQIGTITTEGAGTGSYSYVPKRTAEYRAVWAGAPDLAATTSASVSASVRFRVVVTPLAARTVTRGTSLSWTATVGPPTAGVSVEFRVYQRTRSGWVLVATAPRTTPASGAVKYTRRMNVPGRWYVQAVALAGPANLGAVASKRYVTVLTTR
jgi:hypothetical protein